LCSLGVPFVARPVDDIHIGCKMAEDNMDLEAFDTSEAAAAEVAAAAAAVGGAGHPAVTSQAAAAVEAAAFHQAAEYECFVAYAVHHNLEIQLTRGQQFLIEPGRIMAFGMYS